MKKLLLLLPLLLAPTPVMAQQVNYTQICTEYREVYIPGGYDYYGYYYPGKVTSERYVVPCNGNVVNYVEPQQSNDRGYVILLLVLRLVMVQLHFRVKLDTTTILTILATVTLVVTTYSIWKQ
jgi:hypothetical protein